MKEATSCPLVYNSGYFESNSGLKLTLPLFDKKKRLLLTWQWKDRMLQFESWTLALPLPIARIVCSSLLGQLSVCRCLSAHPSDWSWGDFVSIVATIMDGEGNRLSCLPSAIQTSPYLDVLSGTQLKSDVEAFCCIFRSRHKVLEMFQCPPMAHYPLLS